MNINETILDIITLVVVRVAVNLPMFILYMQL